MRERESEVKRSASKQQQNNHNQNQSQHNARILPSVARAQNKLLLGPKKKRQQSDSILSTGTLSLSLSPLSVSFSLTVNDRECAQQQKSSKLLKQKDYTHLNNKSMWNEKGQEGLLLTRNWSGLSCESCDVTQIMPIVWHTHTVTHSHTHIPQSSCCAAACNRNAIENAPRACLVFALWRIKILWLEIKQIRI